MDVSKMDQLKVVNIARRQFASNDKISTAVLVTQLSSNCQ